TPPPSCFCHPEHLTQPKTRSLADLLCCEERLKHLVENFVGDACAGVSDGKHHVIAGRWFLGPLRGAQFNIRGSNRDRPTARHRIALVDRQVQNDKFYLARISERQREWTPKSNFNPVSCADGALEEPPHSGDDPIEIDRFRSHALLPREGEKLRRKSRAV